MGDYLSDYEPFAHLLDRVTALEAANNGGSVPVGATLRRAEYRGISQSLDNNGQYAYTLTPGGGDDADQPLDLTDPTNPTIRSAGIYAFTGFVNSIDAHTGATLFVLLSLDDTGFGWNARAAGTLDHGGESYTFACTAWLPAGAVCPLYINHDVGAPALLDVCVAVQQLTLN